VNYVVRPTAGVTAELAEQSRRIQEHFQLIGSLLGENPYPNPQFPLIVEDRRADGETVYTYTDRIFPYAVVYLIVEPDDDETLGAVVVIDLVMISERSS
jgi:hypothetical protein